MSISTSKKLLALALLFSLTSWASPPVIWNGADAKFLNSGSVKIPGLAGVGCAQFDVNGKLTNTGGACGSGSGTVSSVALTVPAFLSVAGSPVTTSGTLAVSLSGTALPIANGGTAGTSAAAGFNNLSPMTTLGDLEYESGANTASRLAGNITTVTQVLTSTGTGSVSAAPVWQALSTIGIGTDWAAAPGVTPTNLGTITNNSFYQRRVGDTGCFQGTFTDGSGTGSSAAIVLPAGLTIDTTKFSSVSNMNVVGTFFYATGGTSAIYASNVGAVLFYDGSTNDRVFISFANQVSGPSLAKVAGSTVSNAGPNYAQFCVPISGWSMNTVGINQGTVLAAYGLAVQYTPSGSTAVKYDTKISDAATNYSTSTGLFTSPVTGTISVKACGQITTGSTDFYIVKNGSAGTPGGHLFDVASGTTSGHCGSMDIPVVAGDTIGVYQNSAHPLSASDGSGYLNWASFTLASGNGSGNVSSTTTNSEHVEEANFTCSSSSTINSQSGNWASSIGNISSGKCSVTVKAGEWSVTPKCPTSRTGTATTRAGCHANPTSTTNVDLYCVTDAGAADTSCTCDSLCMGPQ